VKCLSEKISLLTNVESEIIFYFVWMEMIGIKGWFEKGIKGLALDLKRHEKSIANALDTLENKKIIVTQKVHNNIWIKQTLSEEELNTRIAFIDHLFCNSRSMQELKSDLEGEINRLKEEKNLSEIILRRKQKENEMVESVIKQITDMDLQVLVNEILVKRDYSNINIPFEEIIHNGLAFFRADMFTKYGEIDEEEFDELGI